MISIYQFDIIIELINWCYPRVIIIKLFWSSLLQKQASVPINWICPKKYSYCVRNTSPYNSLFQIPLHSPYLHRPHETHSRKSSRSSEHYVLPPVCQRSKQSDNRSQPQEAHAHSHRVGSSKTQRLQRHNSVPYQARVSANLSLSYQQRQRCLQSGGGTFRRAWV